MKILFFVRSYDKMAGGIEKMSLLLARGLSERGHDVVIASIDSRDAKPFYEWPTNVVWEKIEVGDPLLKAKYRERFNRGLRLRQIIKKYDIDAGVGFQVGSFAMLRLASIGLNMHSIAAERNSPTLFNFIRRGRTKRFFSNLILSTANVIAVQFPEYKKYYLPFNRNSIRITPNPVTIPGFIRAEDSSVLGKKKYLFVGRLTFQKNVEAVIRACSYLPHKYELTIIGAGPDLEFSKNLVRELGVSAIFVEPTHDLKKYFLQSDFLILPSRWEGFPNVVAEALSFGLPVVGFEQCAGIPELICSGLNGWVCNGPMNEFTLLKGIQMASQVNFNPEEVSRTVTKYTYENFVSSWERALSRVG